MNKIAIPALLLGVVMIAGAFAFMPVQEASTVHTSTTNLANQLVIKTATDTTITTGGADADAATLTIELGAPFILLSLSLECDTGDDVAIECSDEEDMDITGVKIDGALTDLNLVISAVAGTDIEGDATRVLNINGEAAESNTVTHTPMNGMAAADKMVFTLLLDTLDNTSGADSNYELTSRVTVLTAGSTTFGDAQITMAP